MITLPLKKILNQSTCTVILGYLCALSCSLLGSTFQGAMMPIGLLFFLSFLGVELLYILKGGFIHECLPLHFFWSVFFCIKSC